ncbi:uncharacterized protein LOC123684479 [Harmonia axyridis]|uniref:uncharacterized protein LOC123684479 n=1 Tax=Harmonia axyridis TaxID=115357 RepID=UPI001E274E03|nr:uncharacterized protein LOC123684479 [Harmonia axyridis]
MAVFQNPPRMFKDEAGEWHFRGDDFWKTILKDVNGSSEYIETEPYDLDNAKNSIMKGETDLCPMSYFRTSIPEDLDFADPLFSEDLVIVVPKSDLIARHKYIFMAFSKSVWFFILISVFIMVLFLVVVGKKRKSQNQSISATLLDVTNILLGKSVQIYPHFSWLEKILLGLCQMNSIVIIAAFNSALISSIFLDKHNDQIDTVKDLIESNLTLYALPEMKNIVEKFAPSLNKQLVKIPRRNYTSLLKNQIYGQALVMPRSLTHEVLENVNVKGSDIEYRIMREPITTGFSTFFFRKSSLLVPIMSEIIKKNSENGVILKYQRVYSSEKHNPPRMFKDDAGEWQIEGNNFWKAILKDFNGSSEYIETAPYDLDNAKNSIMKGEADLCPISYFRTSIPEDLDFSEPLIIEDLMILVPKSDLIPRHMYIFMALSKTVWFFILISVFIMVLFLVVVGKKRKSQNQSISATVLDVTNILLGKSVQIYPHFSWLEKILLGLCQMNSIVIIAAFNSALISSIFMDKHNDQIDTVKDLIESNLTLYALPEMKNIVEKFSPSLNKQLVKIPRRNYNSLLKNQIYGQALVMPESLTLDILGLVNVKGSDIEYRIMREPITTGFSTFFFRKSSLLVPIISQKIKRNRQNGVIGKYWAQKERPSEKHVTQTKRPLSMSHLGGIFLFWLIGIVISIIVFILEKFHMLS